MKIDICVCNKDQIRIIFFKWELKKKKAHYKINEHTYENQMTINEWINVAIVSPHPKMMYIYGMDYCGQMVENDFHYISVM